MIVRFLEEAAVLRTDHAGLFGVLKRLVENPFQSIYKDDTVLSDGKPAPWFTGTDDGALFVCFAMSARHIMTRKRTVNNFIIILKEDNSPTKVLSTVELRRSFGMSVLVSDGKSCKLYAQYIRDLMKILSRMSSMDDIVHKAVGNAMKMSGHDWTTDGKAKIL